MALGAAGRDGPDAYALDAGFVAATPVATEPVLGLALGAIRGAVSGVLLAPGRDEAEPDVALKYAPVG